MDAMKKDQRCKANASAVLPPFCPPLEVFTQKGLRAIAPSPLLIVPSDEGFKLPGQDLNLEWLDQNQLCYQLHHRASVVVAEATCGGSLWKDLCADNARFGEVRGGGSWICCGDSDSITMASELSRWHCSMAAF